MNYSASHPDAVIESSRSVMILHIYSDEPHISEPETCRRASGYFFLSPKSSRNTPISEMPPEIGPGQVECDIMRNVLESANEAELGRFF